MIGPRQFQTPKRILLRIHKDLQKIVMQFEDWNHGDLSDLEVLVLLLEDRRFLQHRGVDLRSVCREALKMTAFRRHGGASTIDMQFVRTQTGYKEIKLSRKIYEMLLAYLLQFHMSKVGILRSYLQVVYLGSGLRGVDDAARVIYGKEVWELNRNECATIAAMMVYPRPRQPTPSWQAKVQRRRDYGLRLFARMGNRYKQRFE